MSPPSFSWLIAQTQSRLKRGGAATAEAPEAVEEEDVAEEVIAHRGAKRYGACQGRVNHSFMCNPFINHYQLNWWF